MQTDCIQSRHCRCPNCQELLAEEADASAAAFDEMLAAHGGQNPLPVHDDIGF